MEGKKWQKKRRKALCCGHWTLWSMWEMLCQPATIFLILTGVVIVLSAICAACGVSVTYDFLDNSKGEITQKTVAAVSLLAPDSIRHMVTTVVGNFTGFFALGTVFTIMIGVGVADGTGFMSALLRKVAASTPKAFVTAVVVFLGIMSNIASSTGYVVLVPLGAVLFMAFGVIQSQVLQQPLQVYPADGVQTF